MTTYTWTVEVGGAALDDVQNITISMGRRQITDVYRANTATISGRVLASLGTVTIGETVEIFCDNGVNTQQVFYGVVADVRVTYGMVTEEDTWQIDVEDNLALLGRAVTTSSFGFTAGWTTWTAASSLCTNVGLNALRSGLESSSTVSAQSFTYANALNVMNQIIATEQGRLHGDNTPDGIRFTARDTYPPTIPVAFSDGSLLPNLGEDVSEFDRIVFRSLADSYFTQVVVTPDGLTAQTSGTGDRTYTLPTFDETTTQAQNLADFVLSQLTVNQDVPQELSVMAHETTFDVASLCSYYQTPFWQVVGVILRSTRYNCQIEGWTISATPESSRWSFSLSSADAVTSFILDSPAFGVLDSSRLGF